MRLALCAAAPRRRRRRRFFHAAAADEITGVIGGVTLLSPIEALGLIRLMAELLNRLIADENNKSSLQSILYTIKGMGFRLKFFENTTSLQALLSS